MAKKTKIKGISNEITRILKEYSDEIEFGMLTIRDGVTKKTAKNLKQTSPKKTGDYRKGWRVTDIKGKKIIHNKTDYQLTHLLENGHAKVSGGRVAPKVHIRPAEEQAIKEYIDLTEKLIRGR
ncbi:MAG: HK97 gp10 family phage protein [Clostridium sp.]|nr:HK97 gp10 family phage protein [Clostridium sp.]